MTKSRQQGFTLIEIAIVLVIIGLLLGGILKGQELITSARVRNLISQQDGIKAAFYGFQDRYRALPGDYNSATTNIQSVTQNGNGDGRITTVAGGGAVEEPILAWEHLAKSGFINGNYTYAATVGDLNTPKNPYGQYVQIAYDNNYFSTVATPPQRHNLKTGNQIPVEIVAEVDRKIDDGNAQTGSFVFSSYSATGGNPTQANCTDNTGVWQLTSGTTEVNCGAASLM